jgi:hypothetical protein
MRRNNPNISAIQTFGKGERYLHINHCVTDRMFNFGVVSFFSRANYTQRHFLTKERSSLPEEKVLPHQEVG